MSKSITILLPAEKLLTLTADSVSSGTLVQLSDSVGGEPSSPIVVAASTTPTFGAFAEPRRYEINSAIGKITFAITPVLGTIDGDLNVTGDEVIDGDSTVSGDSIVTGDETIGGDSAITGVTSDPTTSTNTGTVGTGTTAVENGDGKTHTTTLTLDGVLPAITGGVDQAVGLLIYTFPAGAIIINHAYISVGITQSEGNINLDQPEVGLGTVIGTGGVAVLSTTLENIITGQVAANCTGTATVKTAIPTAAVPFIIETADAHTLHFNVADGWAADGDDAATVAGTVIIDWSFIE